MPTIAERLTQLAEAEAVVKNIRESLQYDLAALKDALPRQRKAKPSTATTPKRTRGPNKPKPAPPVIDDRADYHHGQ